MNTNNSSVNNLEKTNSENTPNNVEIEQFSVTTNLDSNVVPPNLILDTTDHSSVSVDNVNKITDIDSIKEFEDDDFGDFDDFEDGFEDTIQDGDDDFGDFDNVETTLTLEPTDINILCGILENNPTGINEYIHDYLSELWNFDCNSLENIESIDNINYRDPKISKEYNIINTSCSQELWNKLSSDTVFYNPVTGSIGQFQWTKSEINKYYLNSLGVTFRYEEKQLPKLPNQSEKSKQQNSIEDESKPKLISKTALKINETSKNPTMKKSSSLSDGLKIGTSNIDENTKEKLKEVEQELELDIDIARAYCELTEETIRIFPNVKLNAMVTELTRLLRQSSEYIDSLLDQKEQLKIDAETYNDLISCIVGHAQRLHVHSKDSTPVMISKTKKSGGTISNLIKRKTSTAGQQSVSMGGGVVGIKQSSNIPNRSTSTSPHGISDNRSIL